MVGPGYGNWASFDPPAGFEFDRADRVSPVLRLASGPESSEPREFTFVAATACHRWRDRAADAVLMFVEPESHTVLYTYDWG